MTFVVDDLQAVEPDALPDADGIRVERSEGLDEMGFPRVAVIGRTREAVVEYVRENWGEDDQGWFREYVLNRIEEQKDREVLVHLNVEVPDDDIRSADEIADALLAALEVGSDDDQVRATSRSSARWRRRSERWARSPSPAPGSTVPPRRRR